MTVSHQRFHTRKLLFYSQIFQLYFEKLYPWGHSYVQDQTSVTCGVDIHSEARLFAQFSVMSLMLANHKVQVHCRHRKQATLFFCTQRTQ